MSADLHPRSAKRLDGEGADLGIAPRSAVDVLRVAKRGDRRGDAEDADVVRHLQRASGFIVSAWPMRVADAHAGHAVRL